MRRTASGFRSNIRTRADLSTSIVSFIPRTYARSPRPLIALPLSRIPFAFQHFFIAPFAMHSLRPEYCISPRNRHRSPRNSFILIFISHINRTHRVCVCANRGESHAVRGSIANIIFRIHFDTFSGNKFIYAVCGWNDEFEITSRLNTCALRCDAS